MLSAPLATIAVWTRTSDLLARRWAIAAAVFSACAWASAIAASRPSAVKVPVVLFGAGIAAGRHATSATPADIAPTLAFLAGVDMAETDGRVLAEALQAR